MLQYINNLTAYICYKVYFLTTWIENMSYHNALLGKNFLKISQIYRQLLHNQDYM